MTIDYTYCISATQNHLKRAPADSIPCRYRKSLNS